MSGLVDAATCPQITFESTSVEVAGNAVTLKGELMARCLGDDVDLGISIEAIPQ